MKLITEKADHRRGDGHEKRRLSDDHGERAGFAAGCSGRHLRGAIARQHRRRRDTKHRDQQERSCVLVPR
jgi:hypothetical protein